ncbi:MAG: hypothetical protein HUU56_12165 [Bdellovibrionaceae bacterium]|nr:hypothetical protein [Pseudobdellovibrionaceae bacterium]
MKYISLCLFTLLLSFNYSFAQGFDKNEFKRLAHELVSDLEKFYGSSYVDQGFEFDLKKYHEIIEHTEIKGVEQKLFNEYYEMTSDGKEVRINEPADAINYFPGKNLIYYYKSVWENKYSEKKIESLKLMIHHEFVPYFIKRADRSYQFNKKVKEMFESKLQLLDLEEGFYEPIYFGDPLQQLLVKNSWYYVQVDKPNGHIILNVVENPRRDAWALDAYVLPPMLFKVPRQTKFFWIPTPGDLPIKEIELNIDPSFEAYPFVRMISRQSFGMGLVQDRNTISADGKLKSTNTFEKQVIFSKVKDLSNINWERPKSFIVYGFDIREKISCDGVQEKLRLDLIKFCDQIEEKYKVRINKEECRRQQPVITDLKTHALYKKFSCAYSGELSIPMPQNFYPISYDYYRLVLFRWNSMLMRSMNPNLNSLQIGF